MIRGNFQGGRGVPSAQPIEMPFGSWARMGPKNHVLDGVEIPHG